MFVAVATTRNFRQAAETLHMSQPPLSRAIRTLEERLGVRLFDRDTQGVALSRAGKKLLPRAQRILGLIAEAEKAISGDKDPTRLRVGITSALELTWFAKLAARINAHRPWLSVSSVSDTSPRLVRALRSHKLDAAIIALPTEVADLSVTPLDRQPMVVAIPSSHMLARRRTVALTDLQGESVFLFDRARQPAFFDHCQAVFARHGFAPHAIPEPADHHVLLAGVANASAFALLPTSFMSIKRSGVSYRPLKEGDELSIGVGLATSSEDAELRTLLLSCIERLVDETSAATAAPRRGKRGTQAKSMRLTHPSTVARVRFGK
jgi:DNA-binding transcriptional LysR family regulator